MADLRRRKPDDDSGKQVDDDNFSASKASGDAGNGSDDEQSHHKKPSGLTTADSSDHVNINKSFVYFFSIFFVRIQIVWVIWESIFKWFVHYFGFKNEQNIANEAAAFI